MKLVDFSIGWLEDHTLPCPFRYLTGCDCPGCGLQRSILRLLKGEFQESIQIHPAGIPFVLLVVFILVHLKMKWSFAPKVINWLLASIVFISLVNYIMKWNAGLICG